MKGMNSDSPVNSLGKGLRSQGSCYEVLISNSSTRKGQGIRKGKQASYTMVHANFSTSIKQNTCVLQVHKQVGVCMRIQHTEVIESTA